MSSGAPHVPSKRTDVRVSKLGALLQNMKVWSIDGGRSLLGFSPGDTPNARHSRRPKCSGLGVRSSSELPLAHGDCGEEARFDDR